MLQLIRCAGLADKHALFREFSPRDQTWVVSDLQSKWHLQELLLKKETALEDLAVRRATELWKHFAFQLLPRSRVLSNELAQTVFWNWIQPMDLAWAQSPRAVGVVLNQMQMWMSIFADPNHPDLMSQWFGDNPESYTRWGHWFELCALIWRRCQEQSLVMTSWLPAMILNHGVADVQWERALTFDLGPQISQVEGLLIRELSRRFEVRVIYPEAPWAELMQNTLKPYAELLPPAPPRPETWQPEKNPSLVFGRFSTQLAEIKDSVAQVRAWLDQGLPARSLAIVAPDIEHYWPVRP
jgi:hypothetical protein